MEVEEMGSGARNDRPGLQQVMAAARRGRIGAVLVWKLDRWGRSTLDLLALTRQLADAGVRFEAITQGLVIDPRRFDPTAQLILTVLAAVAAFEREIIRERTLLGLERARRAGRRLGRPPRRDLDPEVIAALRAAGRPWKAVAAELRCSVPAARWAAAKGTWRKER
jgi:DNA invertase Pin-like site-specific DNA recombinase